MTFLFWPFMIASLIISVLALGLKKSRLLVVSSILIIPFSLYLAATPLFGLLGLILPAFFIGSAIALKRKIMWLAILLVSPNFILIGWLGYVVLNQ
jgi:hypothetical protein